MKGKLGSPTSLSPHALAQSNAAFSDAWRAGKGDVGRGSIGRLLSGSRTPRFVESRLSALDCAHRAFRWRPRLAREGCSGTGGLALSSGDEDIGVRATSTGRWSSNFETFWYELQNSR